MMAIRCFYKRYHLLNVSLDNRFPPRFLNRDASFFDLCLYALWPRQFQSRDNFSSPAKTVAVRLALSLPRRPDNRVSSSSALSEARRIFGL